MKSTEHRERGVLSPFDPEELLTGDELIARAISRADRHAQSSKVHNVAPRSHSLRIQASAIPAKYHKSGTTPAAPPNPETRVPRRSIAPEGLQTLRDRVTQSIQARDKATLRQSAAEKQVVLKGPEAVPRRQISTASKTAVSNKKRKRQKFHPTYREENTIKGGIRPVGNNLVWVPPKGIANAKESGASSEPAKKTARR